MLVRALLLYLLFYLAYRLYKGYRQMRRQIDDRKVSENRGKRYRVHIDKGKIEDAEYHEIKDDE